MVRKDNLIGNLEVLVRQTIPVLSFPAGAW